MTKNHLTIAFLYLTLLTTPALAYASPWQTGGCCSIGSNIIDVGADANVPTTPNPISGTTLYWVGAEANGGTSGYGTQTELRATSSNQWEGYFETIDLSTGLTAEYDWTGVYLDSSGSAQFDDTLNNQNDCLFIADASNSANSLSKCFNVYNYGTAFTQDYAALESYDSTSSHFHSMGNVDFTGYYEYDSGGTKYTPTLISYKSISTPPPSCITSSTGSGTVTISVSC